MPDAVGISSTVTVLKISTDDSRDISTKRDEKRSNQAVKTVIVTSDTRDLAYRKFAKKERRFASARRESVI
jgi:hypothetical protein